MFRRASLIWFSHGNMSLGGMHMTTQSIDAFVGSAISALGIIAHVPVPNHQTSQGPEL